MTRPRPWWEPEVHADRRSGLLARNRIRSAIRGWFEERQFLEVEPGCLQTSPGNETHLHAFRTDLVGPDLQDRAVYLHTSPEFAMKKLLAAGERRIFAVVPAFRNREQGPLHAPEFTMLEWYRAGEPYEAAMDDAEALLSVACAVTGNPVVSWRGRTADTRLAAERLSCVDAFRRHAGLDLSACIGPGGHGSQDRDRFAALAATAGIGAAADDTWSDIFAKVLTARIEPQLGLGRPTFLTHYPACEAALARTSAGDPRFAERFELYVCGVELANGFGEQTDARLQRQRLEEEMAEKQRRYGERYPIDEDFLAALASMPAASGCALGFDRLVMLATGATRIDQVLWTPLAQPGN